MFNIVLVNVLVVILVVLCHYEGLRLSEKINQKLPQLHRRRLVVDVFVALIAHAIEIWIFALVYYAMLQVGDWGALLGNIQGTLMDCAYFSFTVYTSLGFGDIYPHGPIRYLTGIESLIGLVMIGWTASFLYSQIEKSKKH